MGERYFVVHADAAYSTREAAEAQLASLPHLIDAGYLVAVEAPAAAARPDAVVLDIATGQQVAA